MTRSRLPVRLATCAVAACLMVLPSCVKASVSLVLNKDGSGMITESAVMDMSKLGELMEMAKSMGAGGEGGEGGEGPGDIQGKIDDETNPEKIKEKLKGKKGIEIVSVTRTDDPEKKTQTSESKIKFESLEAYFRSGAEENVIVSLEQVAGGAWKFTRQIVRQGMDESGEMPEEAAGMMEMMKGMLQPYMEGMEMSATMSVPGTIIETNGTKNAEGTSVTWKYNFENLFSKDVLKSFVVFSGEGLNLKPFRISVDAEGNAKDATAAPTTPAPAPAPEPAPVEPK